MSNRSSKKLGVAINNMYLTEDQRWDAIVGRDIDSGDGFIYAVSTTGVYCRPNCSSRLPNRENVVFFDNYEDAERAGYRACKRCKPDRSFSGGQMDERILRVCRLLEEEEDSPTLQDLAVKVGLSRSHLQRRFKAIVGITPKEYASSVRLRRLQKSLAEGSPVTEAIYEAGFGSNSRFYEDSESRLGMAPLKYKKGGAGLEIRYAAAPCFLGLVLVAATGRGVCSIEFGKSEEELIAMLRERFPHATIENGETDFARWVEKIVSFIHSPGQGLDLPLDIQGTAFQRRVWKALRQIPPGATATYTEVAQTIGNPKAARAVANACASNRLAVAVPCHRVVGSNGKLGGYRWGTDLKKVILDREAETRTQAPLDSGDHKGRE